MTNERDSRWDRNQGVIEALRANNGRSESGGPMLIMHTKGAKTGKPHVVPVMYLPDGHRYVVFASKGGDPVSPSWYFNLIANPDIDIEVNGETVPVRATEIKGTEHDALYARQAAAYPNFGEYQAKATRVIPVIAFERRQS